MRAWDPAPSFSPVCRYDIEVTVDGHAIGSSPFTVKVPSSVQAFISLPKQRSRHVVCRWRQQRLASQTAWFVHHTPFLYAPVTAESISSRAKMRCVPLYLNVIPRYQVRLGESEPTRFVYCCFDAVRQHAPRTFDIR
jgi:hypothetical protein